MEFGMKSTDKLNELITALVAARANFKTIERNKSNTHLKYKYADLSAVLDAVVPALCENGLTLMQWVEVIDSGHFCFTRLSHRSGEWIEVSMPMVFGKTDIHSWASALTYAKRYSVASLLSVVSDDDNDGAPDGKPVEMGKRSAIKPKIDEKKAEMMDEAHACIIEQKLIGNDELKKKIYNHLGVQNIRQVADEKHETVLRWIEKGKGSSHETR